MDVLNKAGDINRAYWTYLYQLSTNLIHKIKYHIWKKIFSPFFIADLRLDLGVLSVDKFWFVTFSTKLVLLGDILANDTVLTVLYSPLLGNSTLVWGEGGVWPFSSWVMPVSLSLLSPADACIGLAAEVVFSTSLCGRGEMQSSDLSVNDLVCTGDTTSRLPWPWFTAGLTSEPWTHRKRFQYKLGNIYCLSKPKHFINVRYCEQKMGLM